MIHSLPISLGTSVVFPLGAFIEPAPRFYEKRWTELCAGADSLARGPLGLRRRALSLVTSLLLLSLKAAEI